VGLPVVAIVWNLFERAPRALRFAIQFREEEFRQFHDPPPDQHINLGAAAVVTAAFADWPPRTLTAEDAEGAEERQPGGALPRRRDAGFAGVRVITKLHSRAAGEFMLFVSGVS
jgi:hypothetical protein